MHRGLGAFIAIVAIGPVAHAIQPPAPAPTPEQGAMVTVEGCVTAVTPPGSPPDAARASTSTTTLYVLMGPQAAALVNPAPETPRGATASGNPKPSRPMYVLRAQAGTVDIAAHRGQQVRVTGATTAPMTSAPLAGRSPEATPTPGTTAPPGATGTVFDTSNLPTLAITSLVVTAKICAVT